MDVGSVEEVRGLQLEQVRSMGNEQLASILNSLFVQLDEEDVQLFGR